MHHLFQTLSFFLYFLAGRHLSENFNKVPPVKHNRIEEYLRHKLNVYEKSLDRKRKTMDRKKLRPKVGQSVLRPYRQWDSDE